MVYWLAGLRQDAGAFFTFLLIFIVVIITAQSYGFVISAVTPTYEVASIIVPVCMIFIMLFGGFYLVPSSLSLSLPIPFLFQSYLHSMMLGVYIRVVGSHAPSSRQRGPNRLSWPISICRLL